MSRIRAENLTSRLLPVVALIFLLGCDNLAGPARPVPQNPADFSTERLPGVSIATARPAALAAMKEHFRIDTESSTATVLRSRPIESTTRADDEAPRVREVLSGSEHRNRRREIAEVQLVERGPGVLVRCQVRVQRLDVAERSAFVPQRSADDRPANLPTERRPATTSLMPEDWVYVGRNRQLERTILDSIAERLAGTIAATRPVAP